MEREAEMQARKMEAIYRKWYRLADRSEEGSSMRLVSCLATAPRMAPEVTSQYATRSHRTFSLAHEFGHLGSQHPRANARQCSFNPHCIALLDVTLDRTIHAFTALSFDAEDTHTFARQLLKMMRSCGTLEA
eukprot:977549-Rhodomonas_salina.1